MADFPLSSSLRYLRDTQHASALAMAAEDYPDIGDDLQAHLSASLAELVEAGEDTAASLTTLLENHLTPLVKAAVERAATKDLTAARQLTIALNLPELTEGQAVDRAAVTALEELHYPNFALAGLGAALTVRAAVHHEREYDLAALAAISRPLVDWLGDNGQVREAMAAVEYAMDNYAELDEPERISHLPGMAKSLHKLEADFAEAGRSEDALNAAFQASDLYQELTSSDRATYLPYLARAARKCAVHFAATGHLDAAVSNAERAIGFYEELVETDRAAHLPGLAQSLNNLAAHLTEKGRDSEALAAARRAAGIYQELTEDDRTA